MTIVSSLLDLQAQFIDDEKAQQAFKDSQNRIVSMARIHQQLYSTENLDQIKMQGYVQTLADQLSASYGGPDTIITPKISDITLDLKSAIPCGLIINEVVTNALKYAFPKEENRTRTNEVHIEMYVDQDQQLKLIISDNGIGLPADFNWRNASSFGLQLIKIFAQQLGASIEVATTRGTTFTITLPKPTNR